MRWGWLFNRFEDPHLRLLPEQRRRALDLATRTLRGRLIAWTALVVLPPFLLALWGSGAAGEWVRAATGLPGWASHGLVVGGVMLLLWPWSAWVYGRVYLRPYRCALREIGVPVCVACGYALDALAPGATCPECGWREGDERR